MAFQLGKFYVCIFEICLICTSTIANVGRNKVGLNNNQIFGVSRRLLDTRRPREKPNKEHQEEGLIPYGPIPDERKMFLSYSLEVRIKLQIANDFLYGTKEKNPRTLFNI